ncbi:MAG: DUF3341 domain-containing protein [Chloroflexi bacterium]|nr:DUF3341 domain-containing protein [Chloroflexota bacterium]
MANRNLLGLFSTADAAAQATDVLADAGFTQDNFDVLTGSPYPEGAFGEKEPRHHVYVFPLIGALMGLTVAILLTSGTQIAYPVVTGGKPILAIPAMTIIAYEGTLLGAVIFTILGIIFESRLPRPRLAPYDPRITEGYIGLLVTCQEDRLEAAEQALRRANAEDVIHEGSRAAWR